MTIPATVSRYLDDAGVSYDVVKHPHTGSSMETAESAHVSGEVIAKGVVLKDHRGFMLAVVPASHVLSLRRVSEESGRSLELAAEKELTDLFADCDPGAVPVIGKAYGLETVLDESLSKQSDIYFEAGDHEELIHVSAQDFDRLMKDSPRATLSVHRG